jgi:lipopolysaccharide assembly outer membrane protein LptD (OstA)
VGKVYLRAADIIERYVVEATDEEIIILHGNIDMHLLNYNLLADRVIYSLSNGEVYADGHLRIQNDEQQLEGGWFLFNRDQNKGILSGGETKFLFFTVKGDSIKFFDEKFFADDSSLSFSKLTPTAHDFLTSKIYLWDNENILVFNAIYKVGEQPLFYFPLFIQNKFGTGIITSFGESAKEGVYVQNHKVFNFYGVSHKIRFDIYQRLGFLIGDEITFRNDTQDVSLNAMFALGRQYYLLDSSISSRVGFDTRYVNYFNNGEPGKFIPRYRFDYDHTMSIYNSDNISSSVSASLLLLSDLYFQSDFGNIRPQFDVFSFFTTVFGGVDDVGNTSYESSVDNSIRFNNNFHGLNVSLLADLKFEAVRNLSASELNTNFDYYRLKPSRVTLPSLNLSYGNVIGRETS